MMCKNIFEVYLKALTWNSACVWSLAFAKTECTCVRSVKKVCGVQIPQNVWSVQKVCILWFIIVKKVSTDNLLNVGKGSCIKWQHILLFASVLALQLVVGYSYESAVGIKRPRFHWTFLEGSMCPLMAIEVCSWKSPRDGVSLFASFAAAARRSRGV